MSKKVRIDLDLELFKKVLLACGESEEPAFQELNEVLLDKLNRMILREQYTIYKTSNNPAEKEQARQHYLDAKGVPEDFRWNE